MLVNTWGLVNTWTAALPVTYEQTGFVTLDYTFTAEIGKVSTSASGYLVLIDVEGTFIDGEELRIVGPGDGFGSGFSAGFG